VCNTPQHSRTDNAENKADMAGMIIPLHGANSLLLLYGAAFVIMALYLTGIVVVCLSEQLSNAQTAIQPLNTVPQGLPDAIK